jgi:branched-chain amino acid transport system ATP-binding protein/urea transport system ATP-binding protein
MKPELLRVRGLRGGYGRIPILFGIDLSVADGEFVGILGHNGMGKTTLLRTLMGQLPATAGTVHLAGQDITRRAAEGRSHAGLGLVPQGRQIFPALTVSENLQVGALHLPLAAARATIDKVLEDVPRLKPLLSRQGGVLSGGEQQLLALARCLCTRPRLMLLDEPTEGIQPSIVHEIHELLHTISRREGLAVVLVEQDLDFIRGLSDRVLLIRKGVLTDELEPAALADAAFVEEFAGLGG